MVGAPGLEPGTSCTQSRRATILRHTPKHGARWRTRTSDPFHVKEVLYH